MTINTTSQKFLQNLNAILQRGQRDRENILSLLTGAVTQITRTRDENAALQVQLDDMTRKYHAAAEHMRELERKNESLENDIRTMTSAIDAASREFAESDALLADRVVALGSEINVPAVGFGRVGDFVSSPANVPTSPRRAVVRGAPVSIVNDTSDEIDHKMRKTMDALGSLLNSDNSGRPHRPINIV